jgi:hypothetical protein
MNREDIIAMAQEAEMLPPEGYKGHWMWGRDNIKRFATLVAAAEREACAKFAEQFDGEYSALPDAIRARGETN